MTVLRGTRPGSSGIRGISSQKRYLELDDLSESERKSKCLELVETLVGGIAQKIKLSWDEIIFSCPLDDGMHWRGDRIPSASLNWRKLTFYCHVCNRGMGIIDFITETTPMSRAEAFHWVMDGCSGTNPYQYNETPEPQSYHSLDELVPLVGPPHPYLLDRGVPVANIIKHLVGYDSATDCIVIPVFWQGDLVGWQTRPVDDTNITESRPKYMCSAGMKRGRVLYNRDDWHRGWHTVVVESSLTVVAKSHMEFNFVATMGGPTRGQMEIMREIVDSETPVILAYDNDPAGWNDTMQVGNFLSGDDGVLVALNEFDLDEMIDDDLYEVLETAIPYQEWFESVYPQRVAAMKKTA